MLNCLHSTQAIFSFYLGDGAVSSASQEESQSKSILMSILVIAISLLDAVFLVITVILCLKIQRLQPTKRHSVLRGKKA